MFSAQAKHIENFIFVATTGRSGTETLSRILHAGEKVCAEHEPEPVMYNDYPAGLTDKQDYFHELFYQRKLSAIESSVAGCRHYLETNHQFIKNFADFAIETFGDRIRIIHLYRDPISVATSFYRIGSVPGRTERGRLYLIDPQASDNILDIRDLLASPEYQHDMYRCLWYWYETEARITACRNMYPNIKFYKLATDQLNDYTQMQKLLLALNIKFTENNLRQVIGIRKNVKNDDKKFHIERQQVEEMHNQLAAYLEKQYGCQYWRYTY